MNHADVRKRMAEYLEGDLALEERALFDAHLDGCAECARDVQELRHTVRLLRTLPDPDPPPHLAMTVIGRIRSGEADSGFVDRLRAFWDELRAPGIAVPATALVGAFALALISGQFQLPVGSPGTPITADAAGGTLRSIPREAHELARRVFVSTPDGPRSPSAFVGTPGVLVFGDRASLVEGPGASALGLRGAAPRTRLVRSAGSAGARGPVMVVPRSADQWLDVLLADPAGFARALDGQSLAAREHWVRALAERAVEKRLVDQIVLSLRATPGREAGALALDFARQAERASERVSASR